jgi:hypothetical protein
MGNAAPAHPDRMMPFLHPLTIEPEDRRPPGAAPP